MIFLKQRNIMDYIIKNESVNLFTQRVNESSSRRHDTFDSRSGFDPNFPVEMKVTTSCLSEALKENDNLTPLFYKKDTISFEIVEPAFGTHEIVTNVRYKIEKYDSLKSVLKRDGLKVEARLKQ